RADAGSGHGADPQAGRGRPAAAGAPPRAVRTERGNLPFQGPPGPSEAGRARALGDAPRGGGGRRRRLRAELRGGGAPRLGLHRAPGGGFAHPEPAPDALAPPLAAERGGPGGRRPRLLPPARAAPEDPPGAPPRALRSSAAARAAVAQTLPTKA